MYGISAVELYYHDGQVTHIKVGQEFGGEPVVNILVPASSDYPVVKVNTPSKQYSFRGVPFLAVEERFKDGNRG